MPHIFPPWTRSVHHDGSSRYLTKAPSARSGSDGAVAIRLRHAHGAPIRRVFLRYCPDGEQRFVEMKRELERPGCTWWSVSLSVDMPVWRYRFLLITGEGAWWYTARGVQQSQPTDEGDFRIVSDSDGPGWLSGTVFYQIAPDRFCDGDPSISVLTGEYTYGGHPTTRRTWGEDPSSDWEQAHVEFFGGDLKGISERMPYLLDLGINALYLLPVFTAPSNHKYDVTDYENVDPHLGGNEALARLREATAAHDLRLILDIVPNHCGRDHPWFIAASADASAPSSEFFTFTRHPGEYVSWLGHRSLPKLNYVSRRLREYMISGPDAIFKRWLRKPYSVDGWRVDVANMLGRQGSVDLNRELARKIRTAVKAENPGSYLLAEHFFDASAELQGDCWDATMNYAGFTIPLLSWLIRQGFRQHWDPSDVATGGPLSTGALLDSLTAFRSAVPWHVALRQLNLLGSHDTPRVMTSLGGNLNAHRVAVGLLMTYPGVPCLLYGDEVGMEGSDTRILRCMPWERRRWNEEVRSFYQRLIRFRRSSPALCRGGFQVLDHGPEWFAFQRDTESEVVVVVANRGATAPGAVIVDTGGIPDGMVFHEILSRREMRVRDGRLSLTEPGPGISILLAHPPAESARHS